MFLCLTKRKFLQDGKSGKEEGTLLLFKNYFHENVLYIVFGRNISRTVADFVKFHT